MKFVNTSDSPVFVAIGPGGMRCEAKGTIEIPDGYAHPRRNDNGSRRPSVIEQLAPQLEPADPAEKAIWLQAPPARRADVKVANMPTVEAYMAAGMSRGQAEILVRQAHQAVIDALSGGQKDDHRPANVAKEKR